MKRYFSQWKWHAEKAGKKVSISKEHFEYLLKQPCSYCGKQSFYYKSGKIRRGDAPSIDRVDSSIKEYSMENSVSCCQSCNCKKQTKKQFKPRQYNNSPYYPPPLRKLIEMARNAANR